MRVSFEDWPECSVCGEEYNPKRKQLGYSTCLVCGDKEAKKSIAHKKKCTAPLFTLALTLTPMRTFVLGGGVVTTNLLEASPLRGGPHTLLREAAA